MQVWDYDTLSSIKSDGEAVSVMQRLKIVHTERLCPSTACAGLGVSLQLSKDGKRTNGLKWRCNRCNYECSVYDGTFFEKSRVPALSWLKMMYCFAVNEQRQGNLQHELHVSSKTVVECKRRCQDVCFRHFEKHPIKIGGNGHRVEVDECCIARRKYNRGHIVEQRWILGGVDLTTNECFFESIDCRDAKHVISVLRKYVLPDTVLVSDCWSGYRTADLEALHVAHMTVNHSRHFVDPQTGATTNHIESRWQKLRMLSSIRFGLHSSNLRAIIAEHLWRQRYGSNASAMSAFLDHVADLYPLEA